MSLVELPAELLFAIEEHLCWDLECGWDSWRLLHLAQSCRYVSSSVAPLIGSSVGHYASWSSPLAQKMRETPVRHRIRSIKVSMDFHRCAGLGAECKFTDITCVVPIVALCHLNLVHLELHVATDEMLYNIASKVDALPRLRFLRLVSNPASKSLSIDAVVAVTRHCPALETLNLRISSFRDGAVAPKQKAPFRLRCLSIGAMHVEALPFAWLCSSSVGLLEHLVVEIDSGDDIEDMAWLDTDAAKATLAVLPRLTVRLHTKDYVARLLSFTPKLIHLTTHIGAMPSLDTLPRTLAGIHVDRPSIMLPLQFKFVLEGRLQRPDQVTVTVSELGYYGIARDDIAEACERAGLIFHQ